MMVLGKREKHLRQVLTESITLLCRNGLHYSSKISIDAVIGVTLDETSLFYIPINNTHQLLPTENINTITATDSNISSQTRTTREEKCVGGESTTQVVVPHIKGERKTQQDDLTIIKIEPGDSDNRSIQSDDFSRQSGCSQGNNSFPNATLTTAGQIIKMAAAQATKPKTTVVHVTQNVSKSQKKPAKPVRQMNAQKSTQNLSELVSTASDELMEQPMHKQMEEALWNLKPRNVSLPSQASFPPRFCQPRFQPQRHVKGQQQTRIRPVHNDSLPRAFVPPVSRHQRSGSLTNLSISSATVMSPHPPPLTPAPRPYCKPVTAPRRMDELTKTVTATTTMQATYEFQPTASFQKAKEPTPRSMGSRPTSCSNPRQKNVMLATSRLQNVMPSSACEQELSIFNDVDGRTVTVYLGNGDSANDKPTNGQVPNLSGTEDASQDLTELLNITKVAGSISQGDAGVMTACDSKIVATSLCNLIETQNCVTLASSQTMQISKVLKNSQEGHRDADESSAVEKESQVPERRYPKRKRKMSALLREAKKNNSLIAFDGSSEQDSPTLEENNENERVWKEPSKKRNINRTRKKKAEKVTEIKLDPISEQQVSQESEESCRTGPDIESGNVFRPSVETCVATVSNNLNVNAEPAMTAVMETGEPTTDIDRSKMVMGSSEEILPGGVLEPRVQDNMDGLLFNDPKMTNSKVVILRYDEL